MLGNAFATLLIGHLIADFPLQTNRVYAWKKSGWPGLALHALIHVGVTAVLLIHPWQYAGPLLVLGVLHMLTDWVKLHLKCRWETVGFLVDQVVHVGVIYLLSGFVSAEDVIFPPPVLFAILAYTTLPALLTFTNVLRGDLRRMTTRQRVWVSSEDGMLRLAQMLGWPLIVILLVAWVGR